MFQIFHQRTNGLSGDRIYGCVTWTSIVNEVVGIRKTPTIIDL